jgi:hypothetical protein
MRLPDLRQWNILAPAAVLAPVAMLALPGCGPGKTNLDGGGEETGDGDGDGDGDSSGDGDGDGDSSGDGDGGCVSSSDCPTYYFCNANGYCEYEYWCGQPPPHEPGSIEGTPTHPACQPPPDCYTSEDCGPDQHCYDIFCHPNSPLEQCPAPTLLEIPLPPAAGPILDLQFADLDGDGRDELLLLGPNELIVVSGDQAAPVAPNQPAGDQLAVLRVDADEHLDVVIASRETAAGSVWLGDGDGQFLANPGGLDRRVDDLTVIDWPSGGSQELAARPPGGLEALVFSDLDLPTPTVDSYEQWWTIDDLAVGRFEEQADNLVSSEQCRVRIYQQSGTSTSSPGMFGFDDQCRLAVGQFDGDGPDVVFTMVSTSTAAILKSVDQGANLTGYEVPGQFTAITRVELEAGAPALVLVGAGPPALVRFEAGVPSCWASLTQLPAARKAVMGDFDGDGQPELALLDEQGTVHVWTSE